MISAERLAELREMAETAIQIIDAVPEGEVPQGMAADAYLEYLQALNPGFVVELIAEIQRLRAKEDA